MVIVKSTISYRTINITKNCTTNLTCGVVNESTISCISFTMKINCTSILCSVVNESTVSYITATNFKVNCTTKLTCGIVSESTISYSGSNFKKANCTATKTIGRKRCSAVSESTISYTASRMVKVNCTPITCRDTIYKC